MALKQRGKKGIWYVVDLTDNQGKPVRQSTKTTDYKLAEQYEAKLKMDLFNEKNMGVKPDMPMRPVVDDFLAEKELEGMRSLSDYQRQLDWWMAKLPGATLRSFDKGTIVQTIRKKREEDGASNATLNRYCAALRACLNHAVAMDWLARTPVFPKFEEPTARVKWLSAEQVTALLAAAPEHWRALIRMSLATGLRQANVLKMRWEWIDAAARVLTIPGSMFKNGDEFCIPLEDEAWLVVEEQRGQHPDYVFAHKGRPISQIKHEQWKDVREAAGLPDLHWHDMRHAWATNLTRLGVQTQALQRLGGWKTLAMVNKYAHHDVESLRGAAALAGQALAKAMNRAPEPEPQRGAAQILHNPPEEVTRPILKLVVNA